MTNLEYIQTLNKTELACLICAIRNPYILCDCIADTKCEIIKTYIDWLDAERSEADEQYTD